MSSTNETPQTPLTVNELRKHLDEIAQNGGGDCPVMLPYDPGYATLGSRAMLPLLAVDKGFDWEANKVLLRLSERVSAQDKKLHARLSRQSNALMRVGMATSRLGDETLFSLEEQVKTFKNNVSKFIEKGLSNPDD